MTYVDACVIPVPTGRRDDYAGHAQAFSRIARRHGAIRVFDG